MQPECDAPNAGGGAELPRCQFDDPIDTCLDAFPMTVTGKVPKYRLRELAMERLGLPA